MNEALLKKNLSAYCGEFLIHAVDVEGKARGIEQELVKFIGNYTGNPITYAGGVHSMEDLLFVKNLGRNRMNVTIGSALDLFGGSMKWEDVLKSVQGKFNIKKCRRTIVIMPAAFCYLSFIKLKFGYVNSLRTLFTIYDIERNGCALFQSLVTVHVQTAVVYEYILAGFIGDETITLLIVEPL